MVNVMNWFLTFLFLAFETVAVKSQVKWPRGTYGIPKPVSGCPGQNWQEGWRKQDLENTNSRSMFSTDLQLHMEATLTNGDIRRSFCVKTLNQIGESTLWPAGSYCVYQKTQCPIGMKSGKIKWDDEDTVPNQNRHGGTLPDGIFNTDTVINYCCQDQGQWTDSVELPVDQPFYLLPYNSANCQRVKEAISTLEFIVYDTEENNNYDDFTPSHVFKTGNKGLPKIYYCYYEGCQHKLQNENGTISATHFPNYQYCSWSITVNQGFAVSLTFTLLSIPSCDGSYMDIYDGLGDTAPLIMRFCGDNATTGIRLRSTGNNISITLRSGDNRNIHFRADYNTTTPFSGLSWPSGTYSLPKTSTSCPDMWIPGWRKQIMEDNKRTRESSLSPDLPMYMDVSLVDYALTRHFCTKTIDSGTNLNNWPAGKYCIYKKDLCPSGMNAGYIKWDDEDDPKNDQNDKYGILPAGTYGSDSGDVADTEMYFCCNDQGEWSQSIELPIDEPFYLLPYQSDNCQRVKWALSTLGSITYDTEDDNNHDVFDGSYVYTTGGKGIPTIYYCYYKGCKHNFETDNGSFGTDNYPEYQYCSWSITVKDNMEVFLEFVNLEIPDCLENQLTIYDGLDSTAPLLATYCGKNATSGNTLRSTKNIVYVMLKSGDKGGAALRFQAQYKAEEPITGTTWPSGTYGLPKTIAGCPAGWVQGSRKQYMNNDGSFGGATSSPFDMDAVLDLRRRYITRKFCMKTINNGNIKTWPPGKYCIYKKKSCPIEMNEGYISWDDLDSGKNDLDGVLPDGDYISDGDTKIYYCCRDQGSWYDSIKLPVRVPFFLLPHKSKNCQRVKWAMSTLEYITYDTEDDQNRDEFKDSYPYTENTQISLPTIYYCYYEGCQYRMNAESSSYISVVTTPKRDFQYCSWLLSVSHGNISLTFNSVSVPDCSNFINIYDGMSTQSPPLASYSCGTTTGATITSTGRNLFVYVKSGNNVQMETTVGFNATFKNNLPFHITVAPPTTDIITGKRTTITTTTSKALSTAPTASSTKTLSTTSSRSPSTSIKHSTLTQILTTLTLPTTAKTTKQLSTTSIPRKTTSLSTSPSSSSTKLSTLLTQILTTSKLPTSVRKPTTTKEPSTTSPTSRELPITTKQTTTQVSTKTDVPTRKTEGTTELSKPDITIAHTKHIHSNEVDPGKSTGGDDSSTALVIVIPVCVTFLAALLIIMLFYRRRKGNSTSGTVSQDGRISLSSEEYQARYQFPENVSILPKDKQRVNIPCDEKNNPLYETGEDHTYCTIDDVQNKYRKELVLTGTKPDDSAYETPVDQLASTSSFNPVYEGDVNIKPCETVEISIPPKQSQSPYDKPILPQPGKSYYDTPRVLYKTAGNPYDTLPPMNNYNGSPNDKQINPGNKEPSASYANVPNDNNSHYQTPRTEANTNVYEDMHGKDECHLQKAPGTTEC